MFDKKKYTIIVMEPMGYGYSRPPDRDFPPQYHYRDADYAISFMEVNVLDQQNYTRNCHKISFDSVITYFAILSINDKACENRQSRIVKKNTHFQCPQYWP